MTDRTESPWRTLAERLGHDYTAIWNTLFLGPQDTVAGAMLQAQDLLIGRALRVAWAYAIENGKCYEYIAAVDMVTQSNPKLLAEHCLKLLDAVGFERTSND